MASPKRIKDTLRARQLRLHEIDKEVEKVLNERGLIPLGQGTQGQQGAIGSKSGSS